MKTLFYKRLCASALYAMSLFVFNSANAAPPSDVTGVWSAVANAVGGDLEINQKAFDGSYCPVITGFIFGTPIEGYYCIYSGHIVFSRLNARGVPIQIYDAYVSRDGTIDRIGGTFFVWNAKGGGLADESVEFNFDASR